MRDRLIELINEFEELDFFAPPDWWIEHFADHLLANGVIVPPMKLGQICFEPCYYANLIDECRVSSITQKADGSLKIRITNLRHRSAYEITTDKIGKTVFLTREEAEKALKERE